MNTKDNQEAELSDAQILRAAYQARIIDSNHDAIKFESSVIHHLRHFVNMLRATLTTPQVNEEVASGEAVAWMNDSASIMTTGQRNLMIKEGKYGGEFLALAEVAERHDTPLYLHPPTPSPSNVLVEALRVALGALGNAKFLINKHCPEHSWNAGFDRDIQTVKEALATYSASTDSVTISRSEYEAMKADAERVEWLETERVKHGTISFERHGIEWTSLFTVSSQRVPNKPTIREAIDTARKSS